MGAGAWLHGHVVQDGGHAPRLHGAVQRAAELIHDGAEHLHSVRRALLNMFMLV